MARRIPLPRLTHRQRMARWQRERRQRGIVITVFTAILLFTVSLVVWAAADRYYGENLRPTATISGAVIPQRDFMRQLGFELVRFYQEAGVPPGFENDPQLAADKNRYEDGALEHAVEHRVLDRAAREAGVTVTPAQVDEQYLIEFGEYKVRHILVSVPKEAEDPTVADLNAKAKARAIANELRAAPMDQELWDRLAQERSDDTGSKFSGGELGFASSGRYIQEFEDAVRSLGVGQVSEPIKTQFGYHVIQLQEIRRPEDSDLVKRYLTSGFSVGDLKRQARFERLRGEFERRAKEAGLASPTEQVRVARIVINTPSPTSVSFDQFTEALQKQTTVRQELEKGTDFAELAKQHSDELDTKEQGGEVGWIARGVLTHPRTEEVVFSTEPGKVTEPVSTLSQWYVYKVLEKDPAREVTEEQKQQIRTSAYQYWLQRQKRAYDVRKLIIGLNLE